MAVESDRRTGELTPRPVPWLERVAPAKHGSFDASTAAQLGLRAEGVIDFSANGNVIGPSSRVATAIASVDISRYPDRGAIALRSALATCHAVHSSGIVVSSMSRP